MRVFSLSFFTYVLFFCVQIQAQVPELINDPEFRPIARQAVDSLYNFNAEASRQLLEPWKKRYPRHPLWMLFDGMELWWQILADLENTSHDQVFFELMARADYASSRLLRQKTDHADALIIKAVSNGYIARQYANRDEWIASLNQARKAYSAYQYLQEVQPGLPDLKLAGGLKLYYSAHLPEAYPIVRTVSWFLPGGDKQKGLRLLGEAADSSIFAQAEARYFLGNINLLYEHNYPEAARHFEQLYRDYPNNSYYIRILVRSYYRMGDYDKVLKTIEAGLNHWEKNQLPFENVVKEELLAWKGRILYRRGRYQEAIPSLKNAYEAGRALGHPRHRSFHVISGYYLGRSHLRAGNNAEARHYLKAVAEMEAEPDYREQAKKLLENRLE